MICYHVLRMITYDTHHTHDKRHTYDTHHTYDKGLTCDTHHTYNKRLTQDKCHTYDTGLLGDDFPPPPDAGAYKQQYGRMLGWIINYTYLRIHHPLNILIFAQLLTCQSVFHKLMVEV